MWHISDGEKKTELSKILRVSLAVYASDSLLKDTKYPPIFEKHLWVEIHFSQQRNPYLAFILE